MVRHDSSVRLHYNVWTRVSDGRCLRLITCQHNWKGCESDPPIRTGKTEPRDGKEEDIVPSIFFPFKTSLLRHNRKSRPPTSQSHELCFCIQCMHMNARNLESDLKLNKQANWQQNQIRGGPGSVRTIVPIVWGSVSLPSCSPMLSQTHHFSLLIKRPCS